MRKRQTPLTRSSFSRAPSKKKRSGREEFDLERKLANREWDSDEFQKFYFMREKTLLVGVYGAEDWMERVRYSELPRKQYHMQEIKYVIVIILLGNVKGLSCTKFLEIRRRSEEEKRRQAALAAKTKKKKGGSIFRRD